MMKMSTILMTLVVSGEIQRHHSRPVELTQLTRLVLARVCPLLVPCALAIQAGKAEAMGVVLVVSVECKFILILVKSCAIKSVNYNLFISKRKYLVRYNINKIVNSK